MVDLTALMNIGMKSKCKYVRDERWTKTIEIAQNINHVIISFAHKI